MKDRFLGKEADIVFNDVKVKPICVQTARSPPRAFEDNAKKAVNELLEAGIIIEQDKLSIWCSPAHWVPKKNCGEEKNRCRLVVDFKRLNDSISRPVRGSSTIQELR